MDTNQLAQMIEWLDEERRKDKTTIATLEERIARQNEQIDGLQARFRGLESDQAVLSEVGTGGLDNQNIEALRQEIRQVVEQAEVRRLTAEREMERRAEIDRDNLTRTVRELNERVSRYERQASDISELRSERDRLHDLVGTLQQRIDDLNKRMEEPDRRLAFLEEQRRQDTRRISGAETELPEIKKQFDIVRPKLSLIEELAIRNERKLQEMGNSERERREQIQQFIEQQNLVLQQRNQQMDELSTRFNEQEVDMKANLERFESWAQAYREMKRIIDDFERIGDRLERRINEVAEMQRLSEERFRQEWNDWREDDQKRWKQFTLSNDEVWRNHDKDFEQFLKRFDQLSEGLPSLQESVQRLWELERQRAQLYRERYQNMLSEYDQQVSSSEFGTPPPPNGTNGNPLP